MSIAAENTVLHIRAALFNFNKKILNTEINQKSYAKSVSENCDKIQNLQSKVEKITNDKSIINIVLISLIYDISNCIQQMGKLDIENDEFSKLLATQITKSFHNIVGTIITKKDIELNITNNKKVNSICQIKILQFNAQSIKNKASEFNSAITKIQPHVIILNETFLKPKDNFTISNFNVIRCDRKNKNGGGTLIAVIDIIAQNVVSIISEDKFELIHINITSTNFSTNNTELNMIGCYNHSDRSPKTEGFQP